VLLGFGRSPVPARLNLDTLEACDPLPPEPLPDVTCGQPSINPQADGAVFVWKDCDADNWHVKVTSASGYVKYRGSVVSGEAITNIVKDNVESGDKFDDDDETRIDFGLGVSNPWYDAFGFTVACGTDLQFNLTAPSGAQVLVGSERASAPSSFNLNELSLCAVP
jgi:hypothetical protein